MSAYLGDFREDATVNFKWGSTDADGASVTPGAGSPPLEGEIWVYKDDATASEVQTGVTDTRDFDSLTGLHHCKIVTTNAFYVAGADYTVVLKASTIDGQLVNTVLRHFSIENRNSALVLTGITSLAGWLRNMCRSDSPDATALTEINDGSPSGTFTADDSAQAVSEGADAGLTQVTSGTGVTLADDSIDADSIATAGAEEIATALLDLADGIETSLTLREFGRLVSAVLLGKLSHSGTTWTFRDVNDTKDRVVSVSESDGDRTSVTLTDT